MKLVNNSYMVIFLCVLSSKVILIQDDGWKIVPLELRILYILFDDLVVLGNQSGDGAVA